MLVVIRIWTLKRVALSGDFWNYNKKMISIINNIKEHKSQCIFDNFQKFSKNPIFVNFEHFLP